MLGTPASPAMIPPQKQMTGMLGHPVAENPIDRMFDAVYAHHGLNWQFWKNDIADEHDLALAVAALRPLGYRGMAITVPWKVAVIPLLDEVDAPLDDANVTRFCDLLDEMTRRTETRFLVITHHAVTMARMDRLFGVTMVEQGVSQLVSVDLKKAASLVA